MEALPRKLLDELSQRGWTAIPKIPSEELLQPLAERCWQVYNGTWEGALSDAKEAYEELVRASIGTICTPESGHPVSEVH